MKPVGIIVNPWSGANRRHGNREIGRQLERAFGEAAVVVTTSSRDDVPGALERFKEAGAGIYGVSGGDGTLRYVLDKYVELFGEKDIPPFLPLKGGTINMVAGDVGLRGDQPAVAAAVADMVRKGIRLPTVKRNLLRVRDGGRGETVYCFCWMDGAMVRFLQDYYREGATATTAFCLSIRYLLGAVGGGDLEESTASLRIDGAAVLEGGHLFLVASTLRRLAFGLAPFAAEAASGAGFSVLGVDRRYIRRSIPRLLRHLFGGMEGRPDEGFVNTLARTLEVTGAAGYAADGEIFDSGERRLEVTLGPTVPMVSLDAKSSTHGEPQWSR